MNIVLRDRLMDDFFAPFFTEERNVSRSMSANIREDADTYSVDADLPGVDEKDVEIKFHEGVLTISGERKSKSEDDDGKVFRSEISYGKFQRSFNFGNSVDSDKISANFKNGVLEVSLPKKEAKKPKLITLN
jgi:HSP20 family protein